MEPLPRRSLLAAESEARAWFCCEVEFGKLHTDVNRESLIVEAREIILCKQQLKACQSEEDCNYRETRYKHFLLLNCIEC
jgi:hypothetical protein